jgi:uncharacterized protein YutE (UPF0331/DUF86 family)
MQSTSKEEKEHHCVDAVLHARRGLACLVDWYLERDLATLCKNAPATPKQQVRFLIARGVIDELTSRVLERAIQKRNDAEHRYISPTLEVAEDAVELLRRTVFAIRTQSSPEHGPWIFGIISTSTGIWQTRTLRRVSRLVGVSRGFFSFRTAALGRTGVAKNKTKALIRRVLLKETTTDELVQLLLLAGRKFGAPSSYADAQSCELLASEARLHDA